MYVFVLNNLLPLMMLPDTVVPKEPTTSPMAEPVFKVNVVKDRAENHLNAPAEAAPQGRATVSGLLARKGAQQGA